MRIGLRASFALPAYAARRPSPFSAAQRAFARMRRVSFSPLPVFAKRRVSFSPLPVFAKRRLVLPDVNFDNLLCPASVSTARRNTASASGALSVAIVMAGRQRRKERGRVIFIVLWNDVRKQIYDQAVPHRL